MGAAVGVVVAVGIVTGAARGQLPDVPPPTPAAPMLPFAGEVKIDLQLFGVGNIARRGEWAGLRFRVQDTGSKARDVLLRLRGVDADGDSPIYQDDTTTNPGVWQQHWMYCRLPFGYEPGERLVMSAYEAVESEGGGTGTLARVPGRLLGHLAVTPLGGSVLPANVGLMGTMGQRALGLRQYSARDGNEAIAKRGHELTEVALGLTPADFPDRWMGLSAYEAVVWAAGEPSELRGDRAKAARDWVLRGGHLVIVLPPVGQTFTSPASNELYDLIPAVAVARNEGVDLEPYRALLLGAARSDPTREPLRPLPGSAVVHTFTPLPEAGAGEAIRLINGPDGRCIVARRLVGLGAVTLIGLDLNQTALAQFELISADPFWHRILGRRGAVSDPEERAAPGLGGPRRSPVRYDADIPALIQKSGQAAVGVLAGFVVFVVYWLAAGPVGFAVLKRRGSVRHAWVAYLATAAAFTALAWGGASALRPKRAEATTLTLLDHVYGQPVQRARMWASVLIPYYGTAEIAIGEPGVVVETRRLCALSPWEPDGATAVAAFPDARGYVIDSALPDTLRVPARSTVKQVQADWAGGPRWKGMPRPVAADGVSPGTIEFATAPLVVGVTSGAGGTPLLRGTIVHDLPGALRDVTLIVVRGQTGVGRTRTSLISRAHAYSFGAAWGPGETIDLAVATRDTSGPTFLANYLRRFVPAATTIDALGEAVRSDPGGVGQRLTALTLFHHLPPPESSAGTGLADAAVAAQRSAAQGWDLSRWLTQPCLIVVGHLGDGTPVDSPVPLMLDGRALPTPGRTVVRWVYPLPDAPAAFGGAADVEAVPVTPSESDVAETEPAAEGNGS